MSKRRKKTREHDVTERYLAGDYDEDAVDPKERFSDRSKNAEQEKILRTAAQRAAQVAIDVDTLPIGQVIQVYSLFCEVERDNITYLCVTRKTLSRLSKTAIVVGDRIRFRERGTTDEQGRPEAVIEDVLPRQTILTRTASFKGVEQHPIVANAEQMLIVASILQPQVKWGLVDRMIIAAQSGGLKPIVCLNKIDLASADAGSERSEGPDALAALAHYRTLKIATLTTSVAASRGLDELRQLLTNKTTVLAGHSGVGKSSLINAIQPQLDLRTGEISGYTDKGRHTTTSARRYELDFGGAVIDTPGVKLFGLWNMTRENLEDFFPDVVAGSSPAWRVASYRSIAESLKT